MVRSSAYFRWTPRASDNTTWAIHGKQKSGDEEWTKHRVKVLLHMSENHYFSRWKMRGPIQRNTVSLNRTAHSWAVLFSETVFLWIGPLFRRIGPRVSLIRTFSKTNAPIPKKHPVCCCTSTDCIEELGHHNNMSGEHQAAQWRRIWNQVCYWTKHPFKRSVQKGWKGHGKAARNNFSVDRSDLHSSSSRQTSSSAPRSKEASFPTPLHTRPWMCCKKAVLMIIGPLMRIESGTMGQFHAVHIIKWKPSHGAWSSVARNMERKE